jgi:hypothetical protein
VQHTKRKAITHKAGFYKDVSRAWYDLVWGIGIVVARVRRVHSGWVTVQCDARNLVVTHESRDELQKREMHACLPPTSLRQGD